MEKLKDYQLERMLFIDRTLLLQGEIRRSTLVSEFGISLATASGDLAAYSETNLSNLTYDQSTRIHRVAEPFIPLYRHESSFLMGLERDAFEVEHQSIVVLPDSATLGAISRAMKQTKSVVTSYTSQSSTRERTLAPTAFFSTGRRWYVRAFDPEAKAFKNFSLHRFHSARVGESCTVGDDDEWNNRVTLAVIAHPKSSNPDLIQEYRLTDGKLLLRTRYCVAGLLLRDIGVDCSASRSLDPKQYPLALEEPKSARHLPGIKLAPGGDI